MAALLPAMASADVSQTSLLDLGYRQMYSLDFTEAHRTFQAWESAHPEDPMGPVSDAAAYLFAEFDRLHILQSEFFVQNDTFLNRAKPGADPLVKQEFEIDLARGQQLADGRLGKAPKDRNALFASLLRIGLRADYLALVEKRYLASLREVKMARLLAEQLLAKDPSCYDAYLAIGVENYMLSLKPAPVRWLLRLGGAQTDKDEGIQNLRLTAEKGRYLRPYAQLLLAVAALRDHDPGRAKRLLKELASEFPHNPLYGQELARLH
jgi:hypothetical protein